MGLIGEVNPNTGGVSRCWALELRFRIVLVHALGVAVEETSSSLK